MHHMSGLGARYLHLAAHPEAQHDGVPCRGGLGEPTRAILLA